MKHFLPICFLAATLVAGAQDTFYVDQNGESSADTNAGTVDAPWKSLNVGKWTAGCTVVVKGKYHFSGATNSVNVDATLTGIDDAVIYGYEAGTENPGNNNTIFSCSTKKFTVKDIDIINSYFGVETETRNGGGIFTIGASAELTLENVNFKDIYFGGNNTRGGAVRTDGALTATNVTFENCVANTGGAVAIMGSKPAKFTSCVFIGNHNIDRTNSPRGGAIYSHAANCDITIDKCYFEKNVCDSEQDANRRYTAGGAIYLMGASPKLFVSNSTFYGNVAGYTGGVLGVNQTKTTPNILNIRFTNNSFLDNTLLHPTANNGVLFNIAGNSTEHNFTGLLAFINNTSVNNVANDDHTILYCHSNPYDIVIVNNLSLDNLVIKDGENVTEKGYGWALHETNSHEFNSYTISNNIIEGGIGGTHPSFTTADLTTAENANKFPSASQRETYALAPSLVNYEGTHYLPVRAISPAVDAGTNSVQYGDENLVPQTDVLGNDISNGTRDIGSFEYVAGLPTGIDAVGADVDALKLAVDGDMIVAPAKARIINIYSLSGSLIAHVENTDSISVASLAKGAYIVVAIINNRPSTAKIVL